MSIKEKNCRTGRTREIQEVQEVKKAPKKDWEDALTKFIIASDHRFKNAEGAIKILNDGYSDHEARIKSLEEAFGSAGEKPEPAKIKSKPSVTTPGIEIPDSTGEKKPKIVHASNKTMAYTGPRRLYVIHGEDGNYNYSLLFTSCLVAKQYDPEWSVFCVYMENGQYKRPLTAKEAANYEW